MLAGEREFGPNDETDCIAALRARFAFGTRPRRRELKG
jgi:hypothetical protein